MNILVTGASGFIGKHLIRELIQKEHNVFCTLLPGEDNPFGENVSSIVVNPENLNDVIEFLKKNEIDGIIHLASVFLSAHMIDDVNSLVDSNVKFGTAVLECAYQAEVKWFVNTGTFWQNYQDMEYSPVNLYAATKQAFEDIARYYTETDKIKFVTI